jgi:hypothetical protein
LALAVVRNRYTRLEGAVCAGLWEMKRVHASRAEGSGVSSAGRAANAGCSRSLRPFFCSVF